MADTSIHCSVRDVPEARVNVVSSEFSYIVCSLGETVSLFFPNGKHGALAARAIAAVLLRVADEQDAIAPPAPEIEAPPVEVPAPPEAEPVVPHEDIVF